MQLPEHLTIELTRGDIRMGVARHSSLCPITLAATRAVADWQGHASTGHLWLTIYAGDPQTSTHVLQHYRLPEAAARFVQAFDEGLPVEPFTFTVDLPGRSQQPEPSPTDGQLALVGA
jgi:hypothetical protein